LPEGLGKEKVGVWRPVTGSEKVGAGVQNGCPARGLAKATGWAKRKELDSAMLSNPVIGRD
jgi:hypothetical protein